MTGRAERRHQTERWKGKAREWVARCVGRAEANDPAWIGQREACRKPCSRPCCGNPRHQYDGPTRKERFADKPVLPPAPE